MQSASSRNWTRDAVSISYDDNHYTTGNSLSKLLNSHPIVDEYVLDDIKQCEPIISLDKGGKKNISETHEQQSTGDG